MPAAELIKGNRGLAKAQILASIKGIEVVVCSDQNLKQLISNKSLKVIQIGSVILRKTRLLISIKKVGEKMKISQTSTPDDYKFIKKAQSLVLKSDCWWRPTACVFVRNDKIVTTAVSHNPWQTSCQKLSLKPADISLSDGEQISFCDAIHAEKSGIAQAARKGISLDGTSLYVTVCPCEECAKGVIEAGVKRVVFDSDYYDRAGLLLLNKNRIKIAKISKEKK